MKLLYNFKKLDLIDIFNIFVFGSLIFTIVYNIFVGGTYLHNDFRNFLNIEDHARHVIMMADKSMYPGFEFVFPPFAYMIYDLFFKSDTTIIKGMSMYDISLDTYHIYYFSAIFVLLLLAILLCEVFKKENIIKKSLLVLSVCFSYPIYYATLLKGNSVLFVAIILLIAMLLLDKDDDNKLYLWTAIALIAIAFGHKIIPAVFGIELIRRKKYKYAIILAIIGFLLFFLPFWYFDGFETINKYISQILIQESNDFTKTNFYFYLNFLTVKLFNIDLLKNSVILFITQIIFLIFNLFMYFKTDKHWQRMMILCFICYAFIPRTFIYYLAYYLVGLVFYLKDDNKILENANKFDIIFIMFFVLLFMLYLMHFTEGIHFLVSILFIFLIYYDIFVNI